MIARIWHGETPASKADAYLEVLLRSGIPDYASTSGHLQTLVLQSRTEEVAHFLLLTLWESMESVRAFAGEDVEKARYYPEDRDFLLAFEDKVSHFAVVYRSPNVAWPALPTGGP